MEFVNAFNKAVFDTDFDEIELTSKSGKSKKISTSDTIPADYVVWLPRDLSESEARNQAQKSPSGLVAIRLENNERERPEANWKTYAIGTFDEITQFIMESRQ